MTTKDIANELERLDKQETFITFKDYLSDEDKEELKAIHKKQNALRELLAVWQAEERL